MVSHLKHHLVQPLPRSGNPQEALSSAFPSTLLAVVSIRRMSALSKEAAGGAPSAQPWLERLTPPSHGSNRAESSSALALPSLSTSRTACALLLHLHSSRCLKSAALPAVSSLHPNAAITAPVWCMSSVLNLKALS